MLTEHEHVAGNQNSSTGRFSTGQYGDGGLHGFRAGVVAVVDHGAVGELANFAAASDRFEIIQSELYFIVRHAEVSGDRNREQNRTGEVSAGGGDFENGFTDCDLKFVAGLHHFRGDQVVD